MQTLFVGSRTIGIRHGLNQGPRSLTAALSPFFLKIMDTTIPFRTSQCFILFDKQRGRNPLAARVRSRAQETSQARKTSQLADRMGSRADACCSHSQFALSHCALTRHFFFFTTWF